MTRKAHPADEADAAIVRDAVRFSVTIFAGGQYHTESAATESEARDKAAALSKAHPDANREPLIYGINAAGQQGLVTKQETSMNTNTQPVSPTNVIDGIPAFLRRKPDGKLPEGEVDAAVKALARAVGGKTPAKDRYDGVGIGESIRPGAKAKADGAEAPAPAPEPAPAPKPAPAPREKAPKEPKAKAAKPTAKGAKGAKPAAGPHDVAAFTKAAKAGKTAPAPKPNGKAAAPKTNGKAAKAEPAPKAPKVPGKRAAILAAAQEGKVPAAPDFSANTHTRFRPKLQEVVDHVKAGDLKWLRAWKYEGFVSSSPRAIIKYHELALIALEAKAKAARKG
jgi:hypothetical protein